MKTVDARVKTLGDVSGARVVCVDIGPRGEAVDSSVTAEVWEVSGVPAVSADTVLAGKMVDR